MTKRFLFLLLCLASMISVQAKVLPVVPAILPWGADKAWSMKYVMQPDENYHEPAKDSEGLEWTQLGYDDSKWKTLLGPMANGTENRAIHFFKNFTWEGENNTFNLRRTFTLDKVNENGYTLATLQDDSIKVYINGKLVAKTSDIDNIVKFHLNASLFNEGKNQLAICYSAGPLHNFFDYALFAGDDYSNGQYSGLDINGIRYWFNGDGKTACVVGINEGLTTADIPSSITAKEKKYPVTTIARDAFSNSELESVSIPSSINTIEEGAFHHCEKLERTNITDLEAWCRIDFEGDDYDYGGNPLCYGGKLYLNGTWLKDLVIPDSVLEIKRFAFRGGKFMTLTIHPLLIQIGEGAFKGCATLRTATLPEPEVGDGEGVVQLVSLSFIDKEAFCDCSALKSVNFMTIPATIGEAAFACCRSLISAKLGSLQAIQPRTFLECSSLTTVNIPKTITSIGEEAFAYCGSLSIDLELPKGLTTIDNNAFGGCGSIKSLSLPNSLTTIGDRAFSGLSSIPSLYIPNSVSKIGEMAFVGLSNVQSIVVDEDNPNYDSRNDCDALIETKSGKLLAGCRNTIIIDGVTSIEERALSYMPNTIFVLSNSVETIKNNAFGWCSNLKTLVLGSGVSDVGEAIHYSCVPEDVYCYATSVPLTHGRAFVWDGPWLGTLHVRANAIEEYKETAPWNQFENIVPITGDEQFTFDVYLSESLDNSTQLNHYKGSKANVYLERTFHKDNKWSTLCLPFSVTAEEMADENHPLHGATIAALDAEASRLDADSCLQVQLVNKDHITAGIPYFVRWEEGEDLVNPVFRSVTIARTEPVTVEFANELSSDKCKFVGQFSPFKVTRENINEIAHFNTNSILRYLMIPQTLNASFAHFEIPTVEGTGDQSMTSHTLTYPDDIILIAGDANSDQAVDVADVVAIVNYILGEPNEPFIEAAADVTGDGKIDVDDVVAVVNIILDSGQQNAPEMKLFLESCGFIF